MMPHRVVVTGASAGIGLAVCSRLDALGIEVVGVARTFDFASATTPWTRTVQFDLSDPDRTESFAQQLAAQEPDVDALVLCAGAGRFSMLESLSAADIRYLINLNLLAPMLLSRAFVPCFKTRRRGDLVFIGSEAGHVPGQRGTAYCASKFGLRGFARSLRIECAARGVRVCLINPGMTATGFYRDLGFSPGSGDNQHLRAMDVADAVCLALCAPAGTIYDEINLTPANRVIEFHRSDAVAED
jgi:3-hydroxy acid dehydrogenase / malonic semialdehyde reductase